MVLGNRTCRRIVVGTMDKTTPPPVEVEDEIAQLAGVSLRCPIVGADCGHAETCIDDRRTDRAIG
jgi:hypothetical protein